MNKFNRIQKFALIFQIVLVIVTLVIGIISIFMKDFILFLEISLGFLLFLLAYNNEVIYKRKGFTYIYSAAGIILIILAILGMINDVIRIY